MKRLFLFLLFSALAFAQTQTPGAIPCAGNNPPPGTTFGAYLQECQSTAGLRFACNNVLGCRVSGDWVAVGGAGLNTTGSPQTGILTKFTGVTTIGNSGISDNGTTVSTAETVNFANAVHTLPAGVYPSAGSLPATCTAGELAFDTGATAGQNIYQCGSTNTWTQQLNSGGGGVTGSGTTGTLAAWTSSTAIGNAAFGPAGTASNVTGVTASQSTVTLATSPAAGAYRINYYGDVSTAGSGCTVSFTFNWTDASVARILTTGNLILTSQSNTGYISGLWPIWVGSGNVTYTSTVGSGCGSGAYDIHVILEMI